MLTDKQIKARRIVQTVYIPLELAERLDEAAKDFKISRNEVINRSLEMALSSTNRMLNETVREGKMVNQIPTAPVTPVSVEPPTPQQQNQGVVDSSG